jgi:hypothetical protein
MDSAEMAHNLNYLLSTFPMPKTLFASFFVDRHTAAFNRIIAPYTLFSGYSEILNIYEKIIDYLSTVNYQDFPKAVASELQKRFPPTVGRVIPRNDRS